MQNITPFLWFDQNAEEAANYYVSLFRNSKIENISRYSGPREQGSVMTVSFQLDGLEFVALNGGRPRRDSGELDPRFELSASSAVSFVVNCPTQAEVDRLWDELSKEGKPIQCGWITDKFGVTWQIAPRRLLRMLQDPDAEKANRTMKSMMGMIKLDIAELDRAYNGG